MKKKKIKRVSVLALSLVMALSLTSLPVYAGEMQSGVADLTVKSSKVAFAGYEWWVIGDDEDGVYPLKDHITLLSANSNFGYTAFRTGQNSYDEGYTEYSEDGYYFADNPSGMESWTTPNEYAGSTLQQYMESIANGFSEKEQNVITARDLASNATDSNNWSNGKIDYLDGIAGQGIEDQKLWALSEEEWNTINSSTVRAYGYNDYWLRSPTSSDGYGALLGSGFGDITDVIDVEFNLFARPAFNLNLNSVLFTSAASDSGKSAVEVDDGLTSIEEIDEDSTVKFTMKDDDQTLTVNDYDDSYVVSTEDTLEFSYSNATTGSNADTGGKQYVSCVLTDENDDVKYYAKLVDCSEDESAANGKLYISLANVTEGTYTLKIFSEQANGDSYTDFCSEPVTATLAVDENAVGTVSNFSGDVSSTGTTGTDSSISSTGTTSTDTQTGNTTSPQTGDNSTFALWIAIMLMTGAGLTSSLVYLRKHR